MNELILTSSNSIKWKPSTSLSFGFGLNEVGNFKSNTYWESVDMPLFSTEI